MNANEVKKSLLQYLMWQRNFICAAHETALYGGFIADVVGISSERKIYEYEVKVSRSDLMSEIKTIRYGLFGEETKVFNKLHKHREYNSPKRLSFNLIPNKVYFSVPYKLKDEAVELLKGTPYGVADHNGYTHKIAKDFHGNLASNEMIERMARRVCRINLDLSNELIIFVSWWRGLYGE